MYELWAKRREEPDYTFIKRIEPVGAFYEIDSLSSEEFKEAIIVSRVNDSLRFVYYKEYEKERNLRK